MQKAFQHFEDRRIGLRQKNVATREDSDGMAIGQKK
jgi:hypothetical protein